MFASTQFYEASHNILKNGIKQMLITASSSEPGTYAEAVASVLARSTTITSTDMVLSGGTSGYTLTISSNADIIAATTLESTGIAKYICGLSTAADAVLFYITTCTTKKLASGDTVTMPSWTITIVEPTSD